MPENNDKAPYRRKMQKRVETKDDGRLLIYYTFEDAAVEEQKLDSKPETTRK